MKHELESGEWGQVSAVALILDAGEARKQMKICGTSGSKGLVEGGQDDGQALTVPGWGRTVHWSSQHEVALVALGASLKKHSLCLKKNRLDAAGDTGAGAPLDGGEEVGEARQDADGGLGTPRLQRLLEDPDMAARDVLGGLDRRTGPLTGLVEMTADV